MPQISIGSDHAGYEMKEFIKSYLESLKFDVKDHGCDSTESVHYPIYAKSLANEVASNGSRGILTCGSGIGVSITANKVKGIRAALAWNAEIAKLSRQHNDSNILCLPARFISNDDAIKIIDAWLNTDFEAGRHQSRIDLIE